MNLLVGDVYDHAYFDPSHFIKMMTGEEISQSQSSQFFAESDSGSFSYDHGSNIMTVGEFNRLASSVFSNPHVQRESSVSRELAQDQSFSTVLTETESSLENFDSGVVVVEGPEGDPDKWVRRKLVSRVRVSCKQRHVVKRGARTGEKKGEESDTEREESGTEREESDTEREESDTEREESDTEREESDTDLPAAGQYCASASGHF